MLERALPIAIFTFFAVAAAGAQNYPTRPIRMISPNPAGGANDVIGRIAAAQLTAALGQQVVVDNRGGAGGIIGAELGAKAAPDGYTLLAASLATHSVAPNLYKNIPYHAVNDFVPIAMFAQVQNVLSANPSFAPNSVKELVVLAKARPGTINYASAGLGSASHFSGLAFAKAAGIDIVHVPYKGGTPAMAALVAGEAQFNFGPAPASIPLIKAGRLKALAVSGSIRTKALPEIPTVAEAGVAGYASVGWFGLVAPKGTPQAIVMKLHAAIDKSMNSTDGAKQLLNAGGDVVSMTPEAFGAFIRAEYVLYAVLVKEAGLKVE